ncbi:88532b95-296d-43b4-9bfb-982be07c9793 [Sclerotinia trifoliorum]|uniref:88532b95-296d-43b4-9bfb-982be07c9793 n=1 Tax=Sclerotinia trifoliorum TaxID=28548 RepID=A0A8H2VZZ0_9HELO|nr:88532b95-296d-43b4-9bfb-982be07c9793 [Sclerotinia trifoliorum]
MDQMSDSAQDTQTTPNTPELLSDEIEYYNISSPPSTISTNTHDISRARYHMKELETFAVRVEEAAARAFPNRGRSRYAEVLVVLIKWEESDIDAQPEFNALRTMFEICYGFTTDTWSIPSTHSHNKLMLQAMNYIEKHGTEDNLIIIYYGGHATINNSRQATWSCNEDISHASVRWSAIQSVFEESKSDVLYLLDCCSAAGAAPSAGPGVIETIAATDFETWAPGPGRYSFTNALLHVLDEWMHRSSFSAAMLHSEILSVLKHEKPPKFYHGDPYNPENRKTPIYILASEDPKSLSIEICRRTTSGNSWAGTLSSGTVDATDIYSPENLHGLTPEGKLAVPHVLISIALEENQLVDVEAWHKWIRQFPALAQFALVEGVFASHSTIILLSLPVLIWDMLPENLAVSFVAFVESRNLLSQISEKLGVEVQKQQQPKEFRGRPDSDTLQIPPPLPLIQQIEQALHKQKQQTMKDWETHFQKEKVRLEAKVQDARDDAQKKEVELLQERNHREMLEKDIKEMERDMKEIKKESQVIKEEARRAWEELGRYEREERDRTRMLGDGQPTTIGRFQVIPMGPIDGLNPKDNRGRVLGDVAAWVGDVKSETFPVPNGREGARATGPPDLLVERQYQELEGIQVAGPKYPAKHPQETHPNHSVELSSPIHDKTNDVAFDVPLPRPPPGLAKPKSNASHQKFIKDEKSIASFKSIASGVLSPPDSVGSDEIDESTHEEYESALSGAGDEDFGRGDRGSVDYLQEFLDAGDDAPWNLPRQSIIEGNGLLPQDNRDNRSKIPEKVFDPDQVTLEPKSYRAESKHEPTKPKDSHPTALLDWERRGMQQKLAEHALPRPNAETALEPTSPEPTKVKDVDPFTLQALEKGLAQEVVERVLPGDVTPPRTSLELTPRTDVGPLTLQALKTYETLQEEQETHQATRRPERPVEHIPNRLSHITERDGDWEPKSPGQLNSIGSPHSKRRDEKVGNKKAMASMEEAFKILRIPEMEELKKEPEMTRKNSDGSGTGKVPWDSDEKSVGRTESVKHSKGKSSTKKAFEAVDDAVKKEAEALKKKEEEAEEVEALMRLRKGQKEKKRKDEEKEKPKRDGDEKDAAKASSGRDADPKPPIVLGHKHDGKEVLVDSEKALSAVDDAIRKLVIPELEGLKRTDSHKSHKSHKSVKSQRFERSKMSESTNQEPLPKRDESPIKEKGHHRQQSVPGSGDNPARETKETNPKSQKATQVHQPKEGEMNSNFPLQKQKSDRGLWWMERKPPSHQREEQTREHLPPYSQKDKGKAQDMALDPVPTPPLDLSPEAEDKHEIGLLPHEIDVHTWRGFKFANRDVTPSMSSLPTAMPRSSLNTSTIASSPNNPWSQSENSFGTVLPQRNSLDYSRDPRLSLDFSRNGSPHSQASSTSNRNIYNQFSPHSEDRERPFSTPTIPTPLARVPSPPYQHPRFNSNHNANNPYSQFAQFEQSLSTPTLQRINTGSSYHSLDDSARSIQNVPTSTARSIHNVPLTSHPTLAPVFAPSTYNQNHQHAPLSAVDPNSNPKHSFTFTTAPQGPSMHQSPPFYPAELPAFPHSLPLSRSNSNSNAQPPRYLQPDRDRREGRLSSQASYLTQPLPSPSPSETETLLKNLILPELETLEKGERARREEEERSRREWEREFGIL